MAIAELLRPFNRPRPKSSWVDKVAFGIIDGVDEPGVIIKFRDRVDAAGHEHYGPFCFYPETTEEDFQKMMDAESWGREVWDTFYHRNYMVI